MIPFVCILHSNSAEYDPEMVGNALQCISAVFHSVSANSSDFIPSIAVLRADPQVGVQYLYSSRSPNGSLPQAGSSDVCYAPFVDEAAATEASNGKRPDRALPHALRARSLASLRRSVLEGVAATTEAEKSSMSSGDQPPQQSDSWSSVGGALLTSLCFIHSLGGVLGATSTHAHQSLVSQMGSSGHKAVIAIFSNCIDSSPVQMSTECAISTAALALMKMKATVSCFGASVSTLGLGAPGGARLCALSGAFLGVAAQRFAMKDLGTMLDFAQASQEAASEVNEYAPVAKERLCRQFVLQPSMMGRNGQSPSAGSFGWLCPSCMGVSYREDVTPHQRSSAFPCPFCQEV